MADISKVTLSGVTYDLKDANARERLTTLEGIVAGGIEIVVVDELPTASKTTVGKLYFVPHSHGTQDIYDEYITLIGGTTESPSYSWEKIGSTDIDLSGYSKKKHTHTVTSNVTVAEKKVTPTGTVTLPTYTSTVTPTSGDSFATVTSAGTSYSLSGGSCTKADDTTSDFATAGVTVSYDEANNALVFGTASTAKAVTAAGAITYSNPTLSGALPTFGTASALTGVSVDTVADGSASFAGAEMDVTPVLTNNAVTSGVDVDPASV